MRSIIILFLITIVHLVASRTANLATPQQTTENQLTVTIEQYKCPRYNVNIANCAPCHLSSCGWDNQVMNVLCIPYVCRGQCKAIIINQDTNATLQCGTISLKNAKIIQNVLQSLPPKTTPTPVFTPKNFNETDRLSCPRPFRGVGPTIPENCNPCAYKTCTTQYYSQVFCSPYYCDDGLGCRAMHEDDKSNIIQCNQYSLTDQQILSIGGGQ